MGRCGKSARCASGRAGNGSAAHSRPARPAGAQHPRRGMPLPTARSHGAGVPALPRSAKRWPTLTYPNPIPYPTICTRPAATAPASRRLRAAGRAGRRRRRRPPQRGARAQALQHARGSTAARRRGCTNQAGEGGPGRGSTCRGRERGEQGGQVRRGRGLAQLRERAQLARGRRAQRGLPAGQLRERGRQNGGQRRPDPAPQRRRRPCLGRACRAQVKKEGLGSVCRTGRGDAPHRAGSDTGRECGRGSRVPTCGHVGHVRQGCSEVLRRPCDSATQGNS
jgi:hypothetical protein